ncbi:MAG: sulfatase-like hydrolase/transferase [Anaerolineales bacterium]
MTRPRNIIMIVADSLRYDSVYGYGLGRMPYTTSHAAQFHQARSSGCWTLPAHASLFTGMLPHEHGATSQTRNLHASIPTLAEQLREAGYRTQQVTANVVTTDIFGLDRGFDEVHKIWEAIAPRFRTLYKTFILLGKPRVRRLLLSRDGIMHQLSDDLRVGQCWVQNTHGDIFRRSRKILKEGEQEGRGTFLFLNLMETHFPYHVGPTFQLSADAWSDRLGELAGLYHMVNQSFLTSEREYIDDRIGQILRNRQIKSWRLLSKPLDKFIRTLHEDQDNLVIFLADHGDNFGDQDWYYHFTNVTDAGNRVPFFWFDPRHEHKGDFHHPISTRFIHDEILNLCGLPNRGGSLFSEQAINQPIMQSYWYDNHGQTLDKYKYNQLAFVEGRERYLFRRGQWYSAPRQQELEMEATFKPMGNGLNPVLEAVQDRDRREYLSKQVKDFEEFSDEIPM